MQTPQASVGIVLGSMMIARYSTGRPMAGVMVGGSSFAGGFISVARLGIMNRVNDTQIPLDSQFSWGVLGGSLIGTAFAMWYYGWRKQKTRKKKATKKENAH